MKRRYLLKVGTPAGPSTLYSAQPRIQQKLSRPVGKPEPLIWAPKRFRAGHAAARAIPPRGRLRTIHLRHDPVLHLHQKPAPSRAQEYTQIGHCRSRIERRNHPAKTRRKRRPKLRFGGAWPLFCAPIGALFPANLCRPAGSPPRKPRQV